MRLTNYQQPQRDRKQRGVESKYSQCHSAPAVVRLLNLIAQLLFTYLKILYCSGKWAKATKLVTSEERKCIVGGRKEKRVYYFE